METEDDPVYREQALNQYMKAYKDSLKEEEVEEQLRKEQTLKANNAKVVTGQHNAPEATGIGCPEITPVGVVPNSTQSTQSAESSESVETVNQGPTLESENEKVEVLRNGDKLSIDEQIKSTQTDKSKIETELEESKNNLKELESKLVAINQIYADLKNKNL